MKKELIRALTLAIAGSLIVCFSGFPQEILLIRRTVMAQGGGDTIVKTGSNVTSTSTSFADVTGLTWTVSANTDYWFSCELILQSAATTTGAAFAGNGPASPTSFVLQRRIPTSLTAVTGGMARAYNSGAASSGVDITASNMAVELEGLLRNGSNSGTFAIRFASEVGASQVTIIAGSACRYRTV